MNVPVKLDSTMMVLIWHAKNAIILAPNAMNQETQNVQNVLQILQITENLKEIYQINVSVKLGTMMMVRIFHVYNCCKSIAGVVIIQS